DGGPPNGDNVIVPDPIQIDDFPDPRFDVYEWRHASAILRTDFPSEWSDLCEVLGRFRVLRSQVVVGGGGKSKVAQTLDREFKLRGWVEKQFRTQIRVDESSYDSPTHKVDCFKNRVALELEWSNKDPFFDRDLNNFRLLFDLRAVSVGIIITKAASLRPIFEELGIWEKYGTSTTWVSKLIPRIEGGGGGGCPILVFGITRDAFIED
ncbi:MAG TPA: BglII/BstYI family type II restriction endonuclease, partial [Fimbriimonadaceae bacterium]|nr:BglII/BstYI family type II restriction endonuclease [Fimbriimonadaceae bacterium]